MTLYTTVPNGSAGAALAPAFGHFDDLQPGQEVSLNVRLTSELVDTFATLTGDSNPLHMDERFARRTSFRRRVVHGMLLASYVSTLVGTRCPGAGALWNQQKFRWLAPAFIGDEISLSLKITHKSEASRALTISVRALNQHGAVVMDGEGVVTLLQEQRQEQEASLQERVALVTNVSDELGSAIASALAAAGAAVAIHSGEEPGTAHATCEQILESSGRALVVTADLADQHSIEDALHTAERAFDKPVDVLINHSPISPLSRAFLETSWAEVQSAIDAFLRSAFQCCQAVIPSMTARKSGRIVNLGSMHSRGAPPPGWSGTLMSVAGLQAFTRCLAAELGPQGIRVNSISTSLVETDALSRIPERTRKLQAMQTPLRKLATPANVAAVVVALCGPAGDFLTGVDIPVCGGLQM